MALDEQRRVFLKTNPYIRTCLGDATLVELWQKTSTDWLTRGHSLPITVPRGTQSLLARVAGVEGMPGLGVEIEAQEQGPRKRATRKIAKLPRRATSASLPTTRGRDNSKGGGKEDGWESPEEFVEHEEDTKVKPEPTDVDCGQRKRGRLTEEVENAVPFGRRNVKRVKREGDTLNWELAERVNEHGKLTIDVDLLFDN